MTRPGPARPGTIGLWAIGASLCCFLATALLGPSAFQPAMDARFGEPPYSLDVHPSPYLVLGLVVAGVAAGTAGLALCFLAVRRGWRVRAFPLVAAGLLAAVAFMFMPPVGSTDHLNYASYGRMAATGHDPYETRAVDLPKDPVAGAPEEWRSTPSVYGPIATGEQAVASWIGGGSVRLTVFVLSVFNVLAFAATALILYRTSRDEDRRLRTALLWTCNPLLLFHLISGAHNDVLAIAPMVAALTVFDTYATGGRWRMWGRALAAGALTGVGGAIKMPAALAGGGPAWALLREGWKGRRWRALGGLAALAGG
ncbi:MAG TPA: polyprenol phosphomannose-dependent alpha 1,6 mannosyltransferase MptB, partial [Spirillospora sp.]|nr:polyprenol phosphomannose-dependent alpha 1,6 mannosyltransferase MptB [Spirillospora sp.]